MYNPYHFNYIEKKKRARLFPFHTNCTPNEDHRNYGNKYIEQQKELD